MAKSRLLSLLFASTLICSCGGGETTPTSSGDPSSSTEPAPSGYTVKFNTHGGSSLTTLENVTLINESPVTSREFHKFLGWYTTENYETQVNFPYVVDKDQTLHAKWELYLGQLVDNAKLYQNDAKAYIEASYLDEFIEVKVNVEDKIIYNAFSNVSSLNGMNDNIEVVITPNGDLPCGLAENKTLKVMVVPGIGYEVRRFIIADYYQGEWKYSSPLTGGEDIAQRITAEPIDGFDGYTSTIRIPYNMFGKTKADMFGKSSIFFAMRNTDGSTANKTLYAPSDYMGELKYAWSHAILDENNQFVFRQVDNIIFGDSYTDMDFYKTFRADYNGKNTYTAGIGGTRADQWKGDKLAYVLRHNPKNIVIHIGVNDIDDGGTTGNTAFTRIKTMVDTIHETLPECKVNWITITDNYFLPAKASEYHTCNDLMKEYASSLDWLNIIDFASFNSGRRINFISDGLHLNALGYNTFTKMIYDVLEFDYQEGTLFGTSGDNKTSRGFDLSKEDESIETNGIFDQYAFIKEHGTGNFSFETKLSVFQRMNNDPYPKMGLVVKGSSKMLFFFIDLYSNFSGKKVGYVELKNYSGINGSDFKWDESQTSSDLNINYTNGNFVTLKIAYDSTNISLICNGDSIFTIPNTFGGEDVSTGILSFNTALIAKDYSFEN